MIWIIPLVPISVLVRPIRHLLRVMITVDIWDSALCHSLCWAYVHSLILSSQQTQEVGSVSSTFQMRTEVPRDFSLETQRGQVSSPEVTASRDLKPVILTPEPQFKLCTILRYCIGEKHPPVLSSSGHLTTAGGLSFLVPSSTPPAFCLLVERVTERHRGGQRVL